MDGGCAQAARARERMEGVAGTLWYTAPEILAAASYTPLVDLWALGVVMFLLLTGVPPSSPAAQSAPACFALATRGQQVGSDSNSGALEPSFLCRRRATLAETTALPCSSGSSG